MIGAARAEHGEIGTLVRAALPGVGHFPDLEVPERYRELVRGFLSA
ncbi:hypothetical protein [Flindersiella endophytica]